ncbi:MAG: hypothetical protein Q4G69_08630 [Planctomycetia bacterium]|nr:hypothetical protein [Planctomycetia bacterium]
MDRTDQKQIQFALNEPNKAGKNLLFAFFLAVFLAVGCSPLAIPKNFIPQIKSSRTPVPQKKRPEEKTTIFSVGARISSLDVSSDSRYVAVNFLKEKLPDPADPNLILYNHQTELWNIEYRVPRQEALEDLKDLSWVDSAIFDLGGKGNKLLITNREGPAGPAHVHLLDISGKKHFHSFLKDPFQYQKCRLFKGNHWIACENPIGYWHLISRKDQERKVFFPEFEIEEKPDRSNRSDSPDIKESGSASHPNLQKYLVSEVLAVSRNGDLIATLAVPSPDRSRKEEFDHSEKSEKNRNPGKEINSGNKRTIVIWDLKVAGSIPLKNARLPLEAIKISHFKVEDGIEPRKCEFSSQGDIIAVRSKSKYVGLWETANGKLISELGEHKQRIQAIAFAPNNLKLVVATGEERGHLILWDIRKESVHRTYEDPDPECRKITAVAYASDGRSIYYGTEDGDVKVLDLSQPLIQ